ncbi:MAG: hypothetical protein KAJ75_03155, partial [Alphaproteobacteria bacterium]|nr:hypothetical protein [Alphaproteobacteria bacterium]
STAPKATHTASNISNVNHKVTFSQGAGVKATVVHGAKPTAVNSAITTNLPSKGTQLPTGTNLTVRITGIQNPTGESKIFQASGNVTQKPSVPQSQPAQQQQTGQKTINIQQSFQSKSQPFQPTQQIAQQPIQKSTAQPAVQSQAQILIGTVTGNKISGQPIIQTPAGTISINTHVNLPAGTVVTLGVTDITPPPPPLTENAPVRILGQGTGWATLDESLKVLQKADPVMAERINSLIPQAGAKMAVNMITFTGALQAGNISSWLGNAPMKALEKAGANGAALAKKLGKEFKELSGRTKESGKDWRSFTIPMHDGTGIQGITMIVRRQHDRHDDDEQIQRNRIKGGTRFLINLDLSNIGQMQLDGLSYEKDRRLDLIIRTENNLPIEMQNDIRGMFAGSLEALNYSGNVSFVITENFVELSKDEVEVHQGYGLLV